MSTTDKVEQIGNPKGRIALYLDDDEAIWLADLIGSNDGCSRDLIQAVERAYPDDDDPACACCPPFFDGDNRHDHSICEHPCCPTHGLASGSLSAIAEQNRQITALKAENAKLREVLFRIHPYDNQCHENGCDVCSRQAKP